jgi:hypothetical protein
MRLGLQPHLDFSQDEVTSRENGALRQAFLRFSLLRCLRWRTLALGN